MAAEPLLTPADVLERTFRDHVGIVELDQDESPWEIEDRSAAAWAISKIRQAHLLFEQDTVQARAAVAALREEADRIQGEIDVRAERRDREVEFFTVKLTGWLRRLRHEDPDVKSVKLPGGAVQSRARQPDWSIDEESFTRWAEEHAVDLVEIRVVVKKGEVKKALAFETDTGRAYVPDRDVIDPDTGEVVERAYAPGVAVVEQEPSFTVEVEGVQ